MGILKDGKTLREYTHTHTHGYLTNRKGITLVALIITIIVMIILAGVAIAVAVGDGGVINKAQTATDSQKYQTAREQVETQCVYTEQGRVDLTKTFENVSNLKLEEIDYSTEKTKIDGESLIVTLKNGEVIIINGNNGGVKYYKLSNKFEEMVEGRIIVRSKRNIWGRL